MDKIEYPKAKSLGITEFPYYERNENEKLTYYETEDGHWYTSEYDERGNYLKFTNSLYWRETRFDSENREIYFKNSLGSWWSKEYNKDSKIITYEDSDGNYWDNTISIKNPFNDLVA